MVQSKLQMLVYLQQQWHFLRRISPSQSSAVENGAHRCVYFQCLLDKSKHLLLLLPLLLLLLALLLTLYNN